jgi:hypothetical protein
MGRHTAEELEIIALIERMQDRRLTAAEAAIALVRASIGDLSEPPDSGSGKLTQSRLQSRSA